MLDGFHNDEIAVDTIVNHKQRVKKWCCTCLAANAAERLGCLSDFFKTIAQLIQEDIAPTHLLVLVPGPGVIDVGPRIWCEDEGVVHFFRLTYASTSSQVNTFVGSAR